jgi:hypothetical protein
LLGLDRAIVVRKFCEKFHGHSKGAKISSVGDVDERCSEVFPIRGNAELQ